jgi:hypothetical protein
MSSTALTNKQPAQWLANAFKQVDSPIPVYVPMGFLTKLAKEIETTPQDLKAEVLRKGLAEIWQPLNLATNYLERYSKIPYVSDFRQHIGEAVKAYFSGCKHTAIAALIPVLEGIVRKIAKRRGREVGSGTKKINDEFDEFVKREMCSSACYGERVILLESLRDFVRNVLLRNTDSFSGLNQFNRHGISHGIFLDFGFDVNFYREMILLDSLCFCIRLAEGGVSIFAPEPTRNPGDSLSITSSFNA